MPRVDMEASFLELRKVAFHIALFLLPRIQQVALYDLLKMCCMSPIRKMKRTLFQILLGLCLRNSMFHTKCNMFHRRNQSLIRSPRRKASNTVNLAPREIY